MKLYFQSVVGNYILDLLDTPGKEQHRGKLNCVGLAFIDDIIPTNSLAEIMAMDACGVSMGIGSLSDAADQMA